MEVCQLILENVTVKNPPSQNGETPLHLAASKGHVNICQLIIDGVEEDKRNPPDVEGWTPLHCAAELGHLEVCRLIVGRVTDKHPVNAKGKERTRGVGNFGHLQFSGMEPYQAPTTNRPLRLTRSVPDSSGYQAGLRTTEDYHTCLYSRPVKKSQNTFFQCKYMALNLTLGSQV